MNRLAGRKPRKRKNMGKVLLIYKDMRKALHLFTHTATCTVYTITRKYVVGAQRS